MRVKNFITAIKIKIIYFKILFTCLEKIETNITRRDKSVMQEKHVENVKDKNRNNSSRHSVSFFKGRNALFVHSIIRMHKRYSLTELFAKKYIFTAHSVCVCIQLFFYISHLCLLR